MWDLSSVAVDVYLGTNLVACRGPGSKVWSASTAALDGGIGALEQHLATLRRPWRPRVRLWLSGACCRAFMFERPLGTSATELNEVAAQVAPKLTGLQGPCAVWIDGGPKSGSVFGAAVPTGLLEQLTSGLGRSTARLTVIAPWWALVLERQGRAASNGGVIVRDCDSVTVVHRRAGGVDFAKTYAPVLADDEADALISRHRFARERLGVAQQRIDLCRMTAHADANSRPNDTLVALWGKEVA